MGKFLTTFQFIEKSNKIHNNQYNYDKSLYIGQFKKVIITCSVHGDFLQTPANHYLYNGCNKCGYLKPQSKNRSNTKEFIKKVNLIHNDFYDYSLVDYKISHKKVKIICPLHGIFEMLPYCHIQKQGCSKCASNYCIFRKSNWIKKANRKIGTFYIIKCWNETEEFFKLGITFNSVKKGYAGKNIPYNYEIIREIKSYDLSYIWDL